MDNKRNVLTPIDERITRLFKQRLNEIASVKRVVVFGSRARGDASEESELDVFIELNELTPELRRQISEIAWEIGFQEGYIISTLAATTQSITQGPLAASPIMKAIQLEGIVV